jgi:BirA family biotin operon repressor/biotin-[acetyl-CoA-carboxylase] ligase
MVESRLLAERGEDHGTVVCADFQEAGRGRIAGRPWYADRGKNLFFTILLRYGDFSAIPPALTLRTGLALSLAIEDFAPALQGAVQVKWPNDIMISGRKAAGILTESDGKVVYIGVGVNLAQTEFPEELRAKATSLALALRDPSAGEAPYVTTGTAQAEAAARDLGQALSPRAAHRLLELFLARFHAELEAPAPGPAGAETTDWRRRLEQRLYMRGKRVTFLEGAAGQPRTIQGTLEGIGPAGEILIRGDGTETARSFITGELQIYGRP